MNSSPKSQRKRRPPQPFYYYAAKTPAPKALAFLRIGALPLNLARILTLATAGGILAALWLSLEYLVNPDMAFWMDHELLGFLPSPQGHPSEPKTLEQIQQAIAQEGLTAGKPIILKRNFALSSQGGTPKEIALPILSPKQDTPGCSEPCQSIRQIRLYRSLELPLPIRFFLRQPYLRLSKTLAVKGPSGADLLALDQNPFISAGADQPLPITQAAVFDLAPQPGLWIRLTGLQNQGSGVATYGQVLYFNPVREQLSLMVNWVSPPGDVPQWQQVIPGGLPELVINQTVGLEPHYAVYQLEMADGAAHQLRPITLREPAFPNGDYDNALALARSGLWTPAQRLLNQIKQDYPKDWNGVAQSQLAFIRLHANVTQAQANQPSASTVQRILSYLGNGSWSPALDVLQSDRAASKEVREMLLSDTGRLGDRINTALKMNPTDSSIIAWGALLRLIRGSETQALAWAQRQSGGSPTTLGLVQKLIKQLNQAAMPTEEPTSAKTPPLRSPTPRKMPTGQGDPPPSSPSPTPTNPSPAI